MPELYPEVNSKRYSASDDLTLKTHETATFIPLHSELLNAPILQELQSLINSREKIKNDLSKIEEQVKQKPEARKYLNIINKRVQLTENLDKNERRITRKLKETLENSLFKEELRSFPKKTLQLMEDKKQIAEELSEETISEVEVKRLKTQINHVLDHLASKAIYKLYRQDVQTIDIQGVSKPVIPYLKDLSQLHRELYRKVEDKVDNYFIESAEQQIAENTAAASDLSLENSQYENERLDFGCCAAVFNEDESLPPIYTADTEESVVELVLNGANPNRESESLPITPLEQQFASRYVLDQSLNGVNIAKLSIKERPKNNPAKELKAQLKNQLKELKEEEKECQRELEKNKKLVEVHTRAILLRNPEADPTAYADIACSEKYLQVWNDCQQEVKLMKQKQLAADCTAYNFLTDPVEKLPDVKIKKLMAKFPHYKKEFHMQNDMLANYRLVQGPFQETKPTPHLNTTMVENPLDQSVQHPSVVFESDVLFNELNNFNKESETRKLSYKQEFHMQNDIQANYRLVQGPFQETKLTPHLNTTMVENPLDQFVQHSSVVFESDVLFNELNNFNKESGTRKLLFQSLNKQTPKKPSSRLDQSLFFNKTVQRTPEKLISVSVELPFSRLQGSRLFNDTQKAQAKPSNDQEGSQENLLKLLDF